MNQNIETSYKVLRLLEEKPEYTQRKIAKELDFSLGKVNYAISSLVDKGIIKIQRFIKSKNKMGYKYILTPRGIREKYNITRVFLRKKLKEYDEIIKEIEEAKKGSEVKNDI